MVVWVSGRQERRLKGHGGDWQEAAVARESAQGVCCGDGPDRRYAWDSRRLGAIADKDGVSQDTRAEKRHDARKEREKGKSSKGGPGKKLLSPPTSIAGLTGWGETVDWQHTQGFQSVICLPHDLFVRHSSFVRALGL